MSDQVDTPISGRGTELGGTPMSIETPTLYKHDSGDLGSTGELKTEDDVFNVTLSEVKKMFFFLRF